MVLLVPAYVLNQGRYPLRTEQEEKYAREQHLAEAIISYLAEQPGASDTVEGIAEWWIMRNHVRVEVTMVERVLGRLADSGVIEKIGRGDNWRYHLKPRRYHPER